MKNSFFLCLTLGVLLLSSCVKEPKPQPVGDAYMKAVNTVSGSIAQDFYMNGARKNSASIAYGQYTPYITITSGDAQFAFADAGTISGAANAATDLLGVPIGAYATVFYVKVKDVSTSKDAFFAAAYADDMTPPATVGKAKIRVINLNSILNKPISVMSGTKEVLSAIPFGKSSAYIEVDPDSKFTFKGEGVTTSVEKGGDFVVNKNYTIWVDGTAATELTGHIIAQ